MVTNATRTKSIVFASLALLAFTTWHVVAATGRKERSGKRPILPSGAAAAIKRAFPKATIGEVGREREGVLLYEVELKQDDEEIEVEVTGDGQIIEVERKVPKGALPKAVAKTLGKLAGNAKVEEIEKEEIHAVLKLVKLKSPRVVYEVEFIQDGKKVEVKIAQDGTFLGEEVEDEDDDDDDDDEDEKEVTIDQVPAAVKVTLLKEARGNKIEEIEVVTRGGKKVYEAEWEVGDKEVEITVASDGEILRKEVDD
jgi:uncharacterized membrane protein YkoI